jgi:outer membrane lipopolysaccharide assembly protein LptE/RlpB
MPLCTYFLAGCGYRFTGRGTLSPEIQKIAIPIFVNKTREAGIENILTSILIEEFSRTGRVDIVDEPLADAVLKGTITSYNVNPVFYYGGMIRRYRVTITLNMELVKAPKSGGESICQIKGLSENEDYDALPDILLTKAGEMQAVEKIARDLMEEVHDRIFENM